MKKALPPDWKIFPLEEICLSKGQYGSGASGIAYEPSKPRYIRITDIDDNGNLLDNKVSPSTGDDDWKQNTCSDGDLLFARSGATVGKTFLYRKSYGPSVFAGYLICFRPNQEIVLPDYLYHFTKTPAYWAWVKAQQKVVAQPNINAKQYGNELFIPLPPLPEQQRIAAILDKADELRRKRRQGLARLDDLLQSVFLEMFGDPVSNPKGWKLMKFGNVGTLERGKSKHRPRNAPELLDGPYPLIQTGDIANSGCYLQTYTQTYSEIGLRQSRMWKAGVLCITIAANIAKSAILTFDACFPDSVVGFVPDKTVRIEYVHYWRNCSGMKSLS